MTRALLLQHMAGITPAGVRVNVHVQGQTMPVVLDGEPMKAQRNDGNEWVAARDLGDSSDHVRGEQARQVARFNSGHPEQSLGDVRVNLIPNLLRLRLGRDGVNRLGIATSCRARRRITPDADGDVLLPLDAGLSKSKISRVEISRFQILAGEARVVPLRLQDLQHLFGERRQLPVGHRPGADIRTEISCGQSFHAF